MATKRRKVRKTKSHRRYRKSCKYGKLKRKVKTKSGRKRRCKKKRRTKSKRRKRKNKNKSRKNKSRRRKRSYRFVNCGVPTDLSTCTGGEDFISAEEIDVDGDVNDYVQFEDDKSCISRDTWNSLIRNYRQHKTMIKSPFTNAKTWCGANDTYPQNHNDEPRQNDPPLEDLGGGGIVQLAFLQEPPLTELITDPNIGDPTNLQSFEFDGELYGELYNYGLRMRKEFMKTIIDTLNNTPVLSNYSRCTKFIMLWCLDDILYSTFRDNETELWNWITPNILKNILDQCAEILNRFKDDDDILEYFHDDLGDPLGRQYVHSGVFINAQGGIGNINAFEITINVIRDCCRL